MEACLWEVLDDDRNRGETVAAGWGGDTRGGGKEERLEFCIAILKGEDASLRGGDTRKELIGLLLKLGIGRLRENEGGEGEERGEGRAWEVY